MRSFKTLKSAYATIKGFEVMRALRKGPVGIFTFSNDVLSEARIVERAFGVRSCALAETMTMLEKRLLHAKSEPVRRYWPESVQTQKMQQS